MGVSHPLDTLGGAVMKSRPATTLQLNPPNLQSSFGDRVMGKGGFSPPYTSKADEPQRSIATLVNLNPPELNISWVGSIHT